MQILFWPFTIISLMIAIFAIVLKKTKLLIISSILILPMSLYLAVTPRFAVWGLIFPLFYVGAEISLRKKVRWLAISLVLPNFLLLGCLGYIVINQ